MASGGDVQVGTNGSVHWQVTGPSALQTSPLGSASSRKSEGVVYGVAQVPGGAAAIGKKLNAKDVYVVDRGSMPGEFASHFAVTLRFKNKQTAVKELQAAIDGITQTQNKTFATIKVKGIKRSKPTIDPPFEVKVSW